MCARNWCGKCAILSITFAMAEQNRVAVGDLRQSRRHERMNGLKQYGLSGDQQTSGEVPTRFAQRASTFPSPPACAACLRRRGRQAADAAGRRPSPSGRGRIHRWLSAQPSAVSARRTSRTTEAAADCSLSPWERVRVRGIGLPFDTSTRTIPEIVELRESSGRAGGFPRQ